MSELKDIVENLKKDVVLRQRFAVEFLSVYGKKFATQSESDLSNPNSVFWIENEGLSKPTFKDQLTEFLTIKYYPAFVAEVKRRGLDPFSNDSNRVFARLVVSAEMPDLIISADLKQIYELRKKYMEPGIFPQDRDVRELPLDPDTRKKIQDAIGVEVSSENLNHVIEMLEVFYEKKLQQLKLAKLTELNTEAKQQQRNWLHEVNLEIFLESILEYPVTLSKETTLFINNFVKIEFAKVAAELAVEKIQAEGKEMSLAALSPVVESFLGKDHPEAQKIIETAVYTAITLKKPDATKQAHSTVLMQYWIIKKISNNETLSELEKKIIETTPEDDVCRILGRCNLNPTFNEKIEDIVNNIVMEARLAAAIAEDNSSLTADLLLQSVQDEMKRLNFSDICESLNKGLRQDLSAVGLFSLNELKQLVSQLKMSAILCCANVVTIAYQNKEGRTVTGDELNPKVYHPETILIANKKIAEGIAFHQAKKLLSLSDEEQKEQSTLLYDSVICVLGENTDAKVLAKIISDAVIDASIALMDATSLVEKQRREQLTTTYTKYSETSSFVPDDNVRSKMPLVQDVLEKKFGQPASLSTTTSALFKKRTGTGVDGDDELQEITTPNASATNQ